MPSVRLVKETPAETFVDRVRAISWANVLFIMVLSIGFITGAGAACVGIVSLLIEGGERNGVAVILGMIMAGVSFGGLAAVLDL